MEETIGDRLRSLIYGGLQSNVTQFCNDLGYSGNQNMNKIINNVTKNPGVEVFERIKTYHPQVNIEWLITGHGNMFNESHPTQPLTNENETSDVMPRILKQLEQHNDYMRQLCNQFVKI